MVKHAQDNRPAAPGGATYKLQKALAQAGLGSRRDMEQWIIDGRVTVNGTTATIGARVSPHDEVKVDGRVLQAAAPSQLPQVLLYHKPEGEIVSSDDPAGRRGARARGQRHAGPGHDRATRGLESLTW